MMRFDAGKELKISEGVALILGYVYGNVTCIAGFIIGMAIGIELPPSMNVISNLMFVSSLMAITFMLIVYAQNRKKVSS